MNEEADRYYYDIFPVALNMGEEIRYQQITDAFKTGAESMEVYRVSYELEKNRKALADHNIEVLRSKLSEFGKKAKWHDLVKNPNDIPNDNRYVLIKHIPDKQGGVCYRVASYFEEEKCFWSNDLGQGLGCIAAWKELERK